VDKRASNPKFVSKEVGLERIKLTVLYGTSYNIYTVFNNFYAIRWHRRLGLSEIELSVAAERQRSSRLFQRSLNLSA